MHDQDNIQNEENCIADASAATPTATQPLTQKLLNMFQGDKVIWSVFIILCVISLVEVYSASSSLIHRGGTDVPPILRHAIFLLVGTGAILFIHSIPYRFYSLFIFVLFGAVILLIITSFGIGNAVVMNDANRWFRIGRITIQPSELAKISLMGTVAFLLSKQNGDNDKVLFRWMMGLMLVVCGIIAVDNLSTAVLLFGVCFLLMFIGNVSLARLLKTVGGLIAFGAIFLLTLHLLPEEAKQSGPLRRLATWENRIVNFGNKSEETNASNYSLEGPNFQINAAKIAIANGGMFGVFPGNSTARNFLPHAYSDFIYAIIIEEMGLLGGIIVLLLYVMILIRAGMIARKTEKLFPKYLVMGSALMLSIQAFMHMGVNVGLFPVTGQPLPLISLGGTSVIITCAYFGLILSADRFGVKKKEEEDDEAKEDDQELEDKMDEADENIPRPPVEIKAKKKRSANEDIEFEVIKL